MKVTVKAWHGVATWKWVANDDSCGICRMPFDATCSNCKIPGDDCPLVWGQCSHCFHMHCIIKWLESQQLQSAMSSVSGLPPLPPSLSSILSGVRAELRPGLEPAGPRPPASETEPTYSNVPAARSSRTPPPNFIRGSPATGRPRAGPLMPLPRPTRRSPLEHQLERLRCAMSDLRQLDLMLLHQLWSLNDAIQEYRQLTRSPSWDNGYDGSADEEEQGGSARPGHRLPAVSERLSVSSSSSTEYGDL